MATPNTTSSKNSALWVIALSLAVIAVCLILLVTGQQNRLKAATAETLAVEPMAQKSPPSSKLPKSFSVSPRMEPVPTVTRVPETIIKEIEAAPEPPPVATAPAVPQPIVSSGLAPLTTLATNSPTAITGRVTLDGTPPPETPISFDAQCGKLYNGPGMTKFYLASSNGGLADVFVFIGSGFQGKKFPVPGAPVMLNQKGCFFEPYVFGLMAGQKLLIKNSDGILHNVHAEPQADGKNQEFNMGEGPGAIITQTFQYPEMGLKLHCDVHSWMYAYACVVDNPFFAVTDANGNYAISNVPPGHYVLEAYHRKTHGKRIGETQQITVTTGQTTTANFTIKAPPPAKVVQH